MLWKRHGKKHRNIRAALKPTRGVTIEVCFEALIYGHRVIEHSRAVLEAVAERIEQGETVPSLSADFSRRNLSSSSPNKFGAHFLRHQPLAKASGMDNELCVLR